MASSRPVAPLCSHGFLLMLNFRCLLFFLAPDETEVVSPVAFGRPFARGKATVYGSGCGIAGGHPTSAYANGGIPPKGVAQGTDGFTLPKVKDSALGPAKWVRGGVAEVAWAMSANHAAGPYTRCLSSAQL